MVSPLASLVAGLGPQQNVAASIPHNVQAIQQGIQQQKLNEQALQQGQFQQQEQQRAQGLRQAQFMNRLSKQLLSADESQWEQILTPHTGVLQAMGFDLGRLSELNREQLKGVVQQTDAALAGVVDEGQTASQRDRDALLGDLQSNNKQVRDSAAIALGLKGRATGAAPQVVMIGGVPHVFDKQNSKLVKAVVQGEEVTAEDVAESEAIISGTRAGAVADAQAEVKKRVLDASKQLTGGNKLSDAAPLFEALSNADLSSIYGRGESLFPALLRSQEGIDLIAQRDQFVNMLKLGARGELKGQGTISDNESKMLADAVTTLGNPDISPELARASLDNAMTVLRRSAGVEEPQEEIDQELLQFMTPEERALFDGS